MSVRKRHHFALRKQLVNRQCARIIGRDHSRLRFGRNSGAELRHIRFCAVRQGYFAAAPDYSECWQGRGA